MSGVLKGYMPFISIITICFNEAGKIEETCQSVAAQTFSDYEWIVIDGGSTDETVDIVRKYQSHLTYLSSEKDKGIYNAMNKGLKEAKGTYCIFLNGGDSFYASDVLEKYVASYKDAAHHPDLLYGEAINEQTGEYIRYLKDQDININFFSMLRSLHHQATFIKTSLFKTLGIYNESYRIAGDYDWWLRYFTRTAQPDIAYLDGKIAYFNTFGISFNPDHRKNLIQEALRALLLNLKRSPILASQSVYRFYRANYAFKGIRIAYFHISLTQIIRILEILHLKKLVRYLYHKFIKKKDIMTESA
ncbi:MAG TPA: glycosyltransferase family 2 protein [Alphaproteobacteria bacterium]